METQEQLKKINPLSTALAILIILAFVYLVAQGSLFKWPGSSGESQAEDPSIVVKHMAMANGVLPAPSGFPGEIPLENESIIESFTTDFNEPDQRQLLSVSFKSEKTVAEKYAEYQTYLKLASYEISEGPGQNGVKALFGTGSEADISVVISSPNGHTLVQLAYLIK